MNLQEMIKEKKEWRAHKARIKELPKDYQIFYGEIEKYLFKVGITEAGDWMNILFGIYELFAENANHGKNVLEVTGKDVAAFCDNLIASANHSN